MATAPRGAVDGNSTCSKNSQGRTASIGDLIGTGGVFVDGDWVESKDQDPDGDVRLIQLADVGDGVYRDKSSRFLTSAKAKELRCTFLKPNDLLIARMPDPLGRACIFPGDDKPSVTVVDVCIVRTGTGGTNHRWLMHRINSAEIRSAIAALQSGSTRKRISRSNLARIKFSVPPSDEQERIVAEIEKQFTRLDSGVASLKRVQTALKRYRASVLKAGCEGRLVPTEAELSRKENRSYETGEQLLQRILNRRREKWNGKGKYKEPRTPESASTDELPEGWTWATWDQVALSQNGRPFKSAEYQPSGFKLLRPGNLNVSGKVIWNSENTRYVPEHRADENRDLIIRGRELVMNLTAQSLRDEFLGRVCLTTESEQCLLNQRLARITPIIISPEFGLYLLKAWRFRRFVDELNTGSLIQHMFTSQLARFTFPLPPLAEQERIVKELDRRITVIERIELVCAENAERATHLRGSILTRAFDNTSQPAAD